MNTYSPTEAKFEKHIEKFLNSIQYKSFNFKIYNRDLCLISEEVINFIKLTQKEKWEKLKIIYGDEVENKILNRINNEISKRGIIYTCILLQFFAYIR